jgi:uncharacterized protein YneF (UPF0154 family)
MKPLKLSKVVNIVLSIIVIAGVITGIYLLNRESRTTRPVSYKWSQKTEDDFIKDCVGKYKPKIKSQEEEKSTYDYCRCMLQKLESKYSENDLNNVSNEDIKTWDKECRDEIIKPPK